MGFISLKDDVYRILERPEPCVESKLCKNLQTNEKCLF